MVIRPYNRDAHGVGLLQGFPSRDENAYKPLYLMDLRPRVFAHTPKVDVTSYAATIYAGWRRQAEPFMDLWRTQEDENGVGRPDLRKSRPVRDLANFASLFTYCILRGVLGACRWRCPDTGGASLEQVPASPVPAVMP